MYGCATQVYGYDTEAPSKSPPVGETFLIKLILSIIMLLKPSLPGRVGWGLFLLHLQNITHLVKIAPYKMAPVAFFFAAAGVKIVR
jgi:hypothetical protein